MQSTDTIVSPFRRRVRYGIILAVALFGSAHLLFYFGLSDRLSKEANGDIVGAMTHPLDAIESDRGCMLLDRTLVGNARLDFTRMGIKQWSQCRPVHAVEGWSIEHCTTPGENLGQHDANSTESPTCHPGGYFKIQRLFQSADTVDSKATTSCQLKPDIQLSKDTNTNRYASTFLGPDTFRIVLFGPERLSLMQQHSLGDCTYAVPYMISRPGQFWVQKILHIYQNFDAFNEMADDKWSPTYIGNDILAAQPGPGDDHYQFQVCGHCVPVLASEEARGLDDCSKRATDQARQHGIYLAKSPIGSAREAISHPYEWVPARPRCNLTPSQWLFEPVDEGEDMTPEKKAAAQCLDRYRGIYFVGDSHVRQLFSGSMQRLQGRPGPIDSLIKDDDTRTLTAESVTAEYNFDPLLDRLATSIRNEVGWEDDEDDEDETLLHQDDNQEQVPLEIRENFDTVVLGFSQEAARQHWSTEKFVKRTRQVLKGLLMMRKQRQAASGYDTKLKKNNLKVIWLGSPAWTDRARSDDTTVVGDWNTNPRLLYWDMLVNELIADINREAGGDGMADRLSGFEITMPFKASAPDGVHYTQEIPVSSLAAELIHKLDLC
ncbi:hypothetical protein BGZ94_001917 [Podila epigama]|nr:hypothetical protein BGZ94_001917 [Podila epigama]